MAWGEGIDRENKLLMNARTGALKLRARDWEKTNRGCIACGRIIETIEHVVVEYDLDEQFRDKLMFKVEDIIGRYE